ncbi:hypothetical protein O9992_01275 [Vibrio lentus]|nr:hypothetical protein [Vibrio lentus]
MELSMLKMFSIMDISTAELCMRYRYPSINSLAASETQCHHLLHLLFNDILGVTYDFQICELISSHP